VSLLVPFMTGSYVSFNVNHRGHRDHREESQCARWPRCSRWSTSTWSSTH